MIVTWPRLILLLLILLHPSCILPPKEKPQVLSGDELALLSHVRRGKEFALGGRLPLAEREFRLALRLVGGQSSLYNDLGFVVDSAGRYYEAAVLFRKALEIDPDNLSARSNYARALYRKGKLTAAADEYNEVLERYRRLGFDASPERAGSFTRRDLVFAAQNLAFTYAASGRDDEAVCIARAAVQRGDSLFGTAELARFLLALDRLQEARSVLATVVERGDSTIPSAVLMDYGITLYLTNDREGATRAFSRVAETEGGEGRLQLQAQLLQLFARGADIREAEEVTVQERCELWAGIRMGYWPPTLTRDVDLYVQALCSEARVLKPRGTFFGRLLSLNTSP